MRALHAVIVGCEYVHLAGHASRREVGQVLAALLLLVDLALMAIVAAGTRLCAATETRTKDRKTTRKSYPVPGTTRYSGGGCLVKWWEVYGWVFWFCVGERELSDSEAVDTR